MAGFSKEELQQLLTEFLRESRENLEGLDALFVELESDPGNRETIKEIFRRMHTIKGGAGFVGLKITERVAHAAEDILTKALEQGLEVGTDLVSALLAAVDVISGVMTNVEREGGEGENNQRADEVIRQLRAAEAANGIAPTEEPEPPAAPAAPGGQGVTWGLFDDEPEAKPAEKAEEKAKPAAGKELKPEVEKKTTEKSDAAKKPTAKGEAIAVETSIRIDVNLLDKLMNLVGELVLARNQIMQFTQASEDASIVGSGHRLSLVTTELQENIMKTRMQPIGTVFSKFPRIIRDLALSTGKKVNLEIEGQDTELDRTIVEAIRDPLVHIIRNSIDHGIEEPAERTKNGKPAQGRVHIRAYHEGGQVNIAISDDGAGIDVARVKQKAVERSLLQQAEASAMTDKQALQLIFHAGLSTAKQVTNISGRGVGMDVVKSNVEKIGGMIELDSTVGKGTTLRIKIPLTLAIIPALVVGTAGEVFAIPQVNLHELVRLEGDAVRAALEDVQGASVYRLRGKLLPLIRLRDVLELPDPRGGEEVCNILVLTVGAFQFGLVVDEVFDTEEIVVKALSRHLKKIGCYAGATIMGDGRVALILDVEGLLRRSQMLSRSQARSAEQEAKKERRRDVLSVLVFSLGENDRYAVPLTLVNRLEEFSTDRFERVGNSEVVQYRDDILPLIDVSKLLDAESPESDQNDMWAVVVVNVEGKRVGVKVRAIVDVTENDAVFSDSAGARPGVLGTGILQGRTTVFLDMLRLVKDAAPSLFYNDERKAKLRRMTDELHGKRALVVDDSSFFRTLEASYLETEGMEVEQAKDAFEGMEMIAESDYDLLVFDIEMPGMDGIELAGRVRANAGLDHVPILIVSAALNEENRKRAEDAGVTGYRSKLEHKTFMDGVRDVMRIARDRARAAR